MNRSRWTAPSRSRACTVDNPPLRRPVGVRTASTITTSRTPAPFRGQMRKPRCHTVWRCTNSVRLVADRVVAQELVHLEEVHLLGADLGAGVLLEVDRLVAHGLEQLAVEPQRRPLVGDRLPQDLVDVVVVALLDGSDALVGMATEAGQD